MRASIISIGDELLIGQVINTNATQMAQMLTSIGISVNTVLTIGDDGAAIKEALQQSLAKNDIVLITGGLGPTKDDITKKCLCEFFDSELYENAEALANVKRIFDARGYELTPINRQQAWVPRCCTMVNNDVGTAPCMWFDTKNGKVVVSMPGVPHEMDYLMRNKIIPMLQEHFSTGAICNKNILIQGIGESFLSDLIEPWELSLPSNIKLAYLPQSGMVKLRLTGRGDDRHAIDKQIANAVSKLYPIAGQYIVGEDMENLPEAVAHLFTTHHLTLCTAESCTGGSIGSKLTALPGASRYYMGGMITYSNEAKETLLGVQHTTLTQYGAVSEATACEMAAGARKTLHTDYAIATTGIAGPDGGSKEKPVGTVWIGLATPAQTSATLMHFGDIRQQTIERACNKAFSMLIHDINNNQQ